MEMLYDVATVVQTMAVSLGVGGSTIAIFQFFVAVRDDILDSSEKALMKVTYTVLRVAMVLILLSTLFEATALFFQVGPSIFSGAALSAWTVIIILFINAVLMTKHLMPNLFGPAIQASAWYTLGFLLALFSIGRQGFTYTEFWIGYSVFLCLSVLFVNGTVTYLKMRYKKSHQKNDKIATEV